VNRQRAPQQAIGRIFIAHSKASCPSEAVESGHTAYNAAVDKGSLRKEAADVASVYGKSGKPGPRGIVPDGGRVTLPWGERQRSSHDFGTDLREAENSYPL
jgi:hypothetical protein